MSKPVAIACVLFSQITLDTNNFGLKDLMRLEIGPKLDFAIGAEATTY